VSGTVGLIGAYLDDDNNATNSGSAYLFRGLDTATGTVTEAVKLTASDAAAGDNFGTSVSIDGDRFVIGAIWKTSSTGKAYEGTVSSMTTLDEGGASRVISGLSFQSRVDWIIGETTDGNTVILSARDTAEVITAGKSVYIGKEAGSDNNGLAILGKLSATEVFVGSIEGNAGNVLAFGDAATLDIGSIYLAAGNYLGFTSEYTAEEVFDMLNGASLYVSEGESWTEVTLSNYAGLITLSISENATLLSVGAIPEPASSACLLGAVVLFAGLRRRRLRSR
jgi:hypothetical protein